MQDRGLPTAPIGPARTIQVAASNPVSISSAVTVTDNLWETSGASDGKTVFMSGNWDDDFSSDGVKFSQVNPYKMMQGALQNPPSNGQFCCDQVVQYAPQVNRFIWLLQSSLDTKSGQDVDRLAVSSPARLQGSTGLSWTYWDFNPSEIGKPGLWFDYPDLAIGKSDLIWTTNVIGSNGSVIMRIPLNKLASGKGFTYLQSGTLAGGSVYFAWSAGRTGDGKKVWPQPHIEIAVINAATAKLDHMLYIWNAKHGWAWPALTTNARGEVGVAANYGGGNIYAFPYVGILGTNLFKRVSQGLKGISSAGGHYITVRPHYPGGNCFDGFVFDEYPIGVKNNPVYAIFGHANQLCNRG